MDGDRAGDVAGGRFQGDRVRLEEVDLAAAAALEHRRTDETGSRAEIEDAVGGRNRGQAADEQRGGRVQAAVREHARVERPRPLARAPVDGCLVLPAAQAVRVWRRGLSHRDEDPAAAFDDGRAGRRRARGEVPGRRPDAFVAGTVEVDRRAILDPGRGRVEEHGRFPGGPWHAYPDLVEAARRRPGRAELAGGEEAVPAGDFVPRIPQREGEVGGGVSQQQSGGLARGRPGR